MPDAGYASKPNIPAPLFVTIPTAPLPSPVAIPLAPDFFTSLYGSVTRPDNPLGLVATTVSVARIAFCWSSKCAYAFNCLANDGRCAMMASAASFEILTRFLPDLQLHTAA